MTSKRSFALIVLILSGLYSSGQSINSITASLDDVNGSVNLTYNLSSPNAKKRYKVELFCSENGGLTFSDALVGVSGAVGYNVKAGSNNSINWAYFVDMPEFEGKNIVFKIVAKEDIEYKENMMLALGGPKKFYQSVILPGYGNFYVRPGKGYFIITGVVAGLLGTGAYLHYQSQDYYKKYRNSTSAEMAESNFNRANDFGKVSNGLFIAGFGIWTIDIGQVIMKGFSNQRKQKEILRRRQR